MMRCDHCGVILEDEATSCSNCGKPVSPVSVLSPKERESFAGVTIDQDGSERSDRSDRPQQQRVYFRQVHMGGNNKLSGLITLLIIGLVIAIFLFFAVPLIVFLMVGAVVIWILKRLFL
jgi:uncharacterized membrane protein YvbJ